MFISDYKDFFKDVYNRSNEDLRQYIVEKTHSLQSVIENSTYTVIVDALWEDIE